MAMEQLEQAAARKLRIIIEDVETGEKKEQFEGDICVVAVAQTIPPQEGDMVSAGDSGQEMGRSRSQIVMNGTDKQVRQIHAEIAQAIIAITKPQSEGPLVGKVNES